MIQSKRVCFQLLLPKLCLKCIYIAGSENKQPHQTEQTNLSQYQLITIPLIFYDPLVHEPSIIRLSHINHDYFANYRSWCNDRCKTPHAWPTPPWRGLAITALLQDKPWVYAHLLDIQRRLGSEQFPLIPQTYHPDHTHMVRLWFKWNRLFLFSYGWGDTFEETNWIYLLQKALLVHFDLPV